MLISIWILLIILGLINKRSNILTLIQIIFSVLMFTFDYRNPDRILYINNFWMIKSDPSQILNGNPLFNLCLYVFGIFNQYSVVVFFIAVISFCLLYKGIRFYTTSTSLVMSLYLISPFIIDSTQLKNFMAMCIWVFFSKYLYKAMQKDQLDKNVLMYMIGVFISTLVHFSFMYTAIYVFIIFMKVDNFKHTFISIISLMAVSLLVKNLQSILNLLNFGSFRFATSKINDYELNYNIDSANARLKVTVLFFAIVLLLLMVTFKTMNYTLLSKQYYLFITKITVLTLPILFIINFSMEIYRIQRNLLPMYYILLAMTMDQNQVNPTKMHLSISLRNAIMCLISIAIALFYLLTESVIWNYDSVFKMMFHL